jgi:hypothetical protein
MVLNSEAVSPRLLNSGVPRDLETICLKCLEKVPRRRYSSAQELADELGRFLNDEPILARPPGILEQANRWARQHVVAVATLMLLLLFASYGFGLNFPAGSDMHAASALPVVGYLIHDSRSAPNLHWVPPNHIDSEGKESMVASLTAKRTKQE